MACLPEKGSAFKLAHFKPRPLLPAATAEEDADDGGRAGLSDPDTEHRAEPRARGRDARRRGLCRPDQTHHVTSYSSLLLSSLELSDTAIMSLTYELSSVPLHISAKQLLLN